MPPGTPKLKAVLVYSQKDQAFKEQFTDYIQQLKNVQHLSDCSFQNIESINPYRFQQTLQEVDLFLFTCSVSLFVHPNMQASVFQRLVSFHQMKRLRAVTIAFRPWELEKTVLKNVIHLPENGHFVKSTNWDTIDDACNHILQSLCKLCKEWREKKAQLEQAWKQAQIKNTIEGFEAFLKLYPHSWYSKEARNQANVLLEAKLWEEANEKESLEAYYQYLSVTTLNKDRLNEAALKIAEIEEDEERSWKFTADQKRPEFFFRHKALFFEGAHLEETNDRIRHFVEGHIALAGKDYKAPENHYLLNEAKRLPEGEFFSLMSYLSYCGSLRVKIETLLEDRKWDPVFYTLYFIPIGALFGLGLWQWFTGKSQEGGVYIASIFGNAIVYGFVSFFIYRVFKTFSNFFKDEHFLKESIDVIKRHSTKLRVSFLTNDPRMVRKILSVLDHHDQEVHKIEKKNFLYNLIPGNHLRQQWGKGGAA